ncbi:MAG TPA: ABC transporter substrate-binding protein [Gammaproteobacteria bacterium]
MMPTILLRRTFRFKAFYFLLFLNCGLSFAAEPVFKAGFVAPTGADDPFFAEAIEVMRAAAEDLNIELKIDYAARNVSMYSRKRGLKLIKTYKPDYMLTGSWPGGAKYHLQAAQAAGIKSFVFNAPLLGDEDFSVSMPRKELSGWLGQMTPDNRQASYLLADLLIEAARQRKLLDKDGKVRMIAINGDGEDISAQHRFEGLKERVARHKDVVLQEMVLAGWLKETADRETERLLRVYPETAVIWAASDHMAQGVVDAAERMGRKPGEDLLIGGFDWVEENLRQIKAGRITASVGAHILEGAWALVLLYDYHKGVDFADELGLKFHSPMHAITAENIDRYQRLLEGMNWNEVDFTKFSKALNPGLKRYDFSLPAVLKAAGEPR